MLLSYPRKIDDDDDDDEEEEEETVFVSVSLSRALYIAQRNFLWHLPTLTFPRTCKVK
jgi:hypothetical protein